MRKQFGIFLGIALMAGAIGAVSAIAQDKQPPINRVLIERERSLQGDEVGPPPHDRIMFERHLQGPPGPMPPGAPGDFVFLATEMSFGGKLVKGAPYSAQAVTESVNTLSDGNRIVNRSTAAVYRDSEGRVRREQTLRAIGPYANAEGHQTIFISDPVAGTSYTLDPRERVARKMPAMRFKFRQRTPSVEGGKIEGPHAGANVELIEIHPEVMMHKRATETGLAIGVTAPRSHNARTESLGRHSIEGVEAEGSRTIVTIPSGEIGNERAIEIVSERWYSPELQVIVMSKHSDPRFGENSYRLTNIDRSEPSQTLFEVPGDYTVKEPPTGPEPIRMRMRKPGGPE